jgi:glycosyltransferase involved in cell wall biosynthesis
MPTVSAIRNKQRVDVPMERLNSPIPFPEPLPEVPRIPPMEGRITIRAHMDSLTGYGQLVQGVIRELLRRGIEVSVVPIHVWEGGEGWVHPLGEEFKSRFVVQSSDPWELLIAPPQNTPDPRKRTVQFTMWESNRLPASVVEHINQCAAVVTPCEWCMTSFDSSGVKVPIYKCPLAVDTTLYRYVKPGNGPVTFGTGGRIAHGGLRKGLYEVYTAFDRAFPHEADVRLSVKVFPDCNFPEIDDTRVTVIREAYSDAQMVDWYHSLTAYVSCATAEGFGLMPAQAMACGRPVIATQATGHAEYLDTTVGYPVRYDLMRAQDVSPGNQYYDGYWYVPDLADTAKQMRNVYENRTRARQLGKNASERLQAFEWAGFGERLTAILREVGMLT